MKLGAFLFLSFVILAVKGQGDICPPGEEFWPHLNCQLYYVCNNGNPVIQLCPDSTYWNQVDGICDHPGNVPECVGGTRPPTGTTLAPTTAAPTTTAPTTAAPTTAAPTTAGPTTSAPTTTAPTTAAPTTAAPTTEEVPETESTGGPPSTTTARPPGQCPPTGIHKIAHEELCHAYYLCVDGTRIEPYSECAEGLYFDPKIEECNLASEVDCVPPGGSTTAPPGSTTTEPPFPNCPPEGFHYLPYPGNCTLYIVCVDSVPILYRCPEGYLFDTALKQCRPEAIAVCTVKFELFGLYQHQQQSDVQASEHTKAIPESQVFNLPYFRRMFKTYFHI